MTINSPTRKSARLMDMTLFQKVSNTRKELVAGFKVWLDKRNDTLHHTMADWQELYKEYQNREK